MTFFILPSMYDTPLEDIYPRRKSLRLSGYDYRQQGVYFVTLCTQDKLCFFGQIIDCTMRLNQYGNIAESVWQEIPLHYPDINNNIFIVMPNHIHGLISVQEFKRAGLKPAPYQPYTLSEIVRAFKTYSSRRINQLRCTPGVHIWQRGYYEYIIRSEKEYHQIGEYILFNPAKWESDRENPRANRI
ncbi:MAG: transposase [Dehalococcoidales bacterium]|nr:transposase [Dehalococcoidales bacterium]